MKRLSFLVLLLAFLAVGYAHRPSSISSLSSSAASFQPQLVMVASDSERIPLKTPEVSVTSGGGSADDRKNVNDVQKGEEEEIATIPDPPESFNRAMYHFNDKLYFWALKPVAQGYNKVVPVGPRVSVNNFFSNLGFPIRFLSCLLQADSKGAATELGRFAVNTIWGVGGLLDPSSNKDLNIPKKMRIWVKPWEFMEWDRVSTLSGRHLGRTARGILSI